MAQKTEVIYFDDIDGTQSDDIETVIFGYDGVDYEIDLSPANRVRLDEALEDYIAHARRIFRKGSSRRQSSSAKTSKGEASRIRTWAQENGLSVSARGRVPANIRQRYYDAHPE